MAKLQKLSSYQLNDLPNEAILKLFGFMDIKELLSCSQVSKRLRAIANNESLWLKLNLCGRKVPYDFIEKAAENGCQYLSLVFCGIIGLTGKSESSFNLKYLNMSRGCYQSGQGLLKLIQNCSSLQKLSLAYMRMDSDDIQDICQNGKTLQVLDLEGSTINLHNQTEVLQDLFINCEHLMELNVRGLNNNGISQKFLIQTLVDNLTSTILKVNLDDQKVLSDKHVKKLVKRCNKITHLSLRCTLITNNSVQSIIKHLNTSLEKLDVSKTKVDCAALFELKSIPTLKTLIYYRNDGAGVCENLKQQLCHISINEEQKLHIANPEEKVNKIDFNRGDTILCSRRAQANKRKLGQNKIDFDSFWEIRAKQQDLFSGSFSNSAYKNMSSTRLKRRKLR